MKRALVIIDMQRGFGNANALITINRVIKQINRAKKFGDKIIIVEYLPHKIYHKTRPEIIKAIGNYDHIKVYKYINSGANSIIEACKKYAYKIDIFRLCGVNTNACVQSTLIGLHGKDKYKLEIVPEACNGHYGSKIFKEFKDLYQAVVIGPNPVKLKRPVRYI